MSMKARKRPSWKKPKNLRPWNNRVIKGFPWPWKKYWNKTYKDYEYMFETVSGPAW